MEEEGLVPCCLRQVAAALSQGQSVAFEHYTWYLYVSGSENSLSFQIAPNLLTGWMQMFFPPIIFKSKLHKVRNHQSCNFANFIQVVCVCLWYLKTTRVTELISVWGDILSQWWNPGEATWEDVQEVLCFSLQGQIGMCILPLIYVFICTAHLNKRASRGATSAWQRSHFLMQENCFLAS